MGTGTGTGAGSGKFASLSKFMSELEFVLRKVLNGAVSPSRFLKLLSMAHGASNFKNLF